jgi:hypothetical protein
MMFRRPRTREQDCSTAILAERRHNHERSTIVPVWRKSPDCFDAEYCGAEIDLQQEPIPPPFQMAAIPRPC